MIGSAHAAPVRGRRWGGAARPPRHRKPKSKTAHKSTNKVDAKSRAHERPPEPGQRRSHSPHPRRSHRRGHDLTSRTFYTVISVRTNPDSRRATLDSIPHRTPSRRKIHTHIRRYRYFTVGTRDLEPHNVQGHEAEGRRGRLEHARAFPVCGHALSLECPYWARCAVDPAARRHTWRTPPATCARATCSAAIATLGAGAAAVASSWPSSTRVRDSTSTHASPLRIGTKGAKRPTK